ncbi:MAG: Asp-tRNA(Asn)/Glu-tRNA(Gln) amidotransferase subunit GatA [Gemmatimonadota bacterium]
MTGSVPELARAVGSGAVAASELAARTIEAIRELDTGPSGLHAFLSHDPELVLARARAVDAEAEAARRDGRTPGPLAGVPVGIKDNVVTLDHPTTCGSRLLEHFRSPYEATVVRRLRAAGAVIAGKTNLDEFAMGSSTEHSAFGPTRNPHDPERVPGGSSGGSAAAVAAGLVPAALGSDTGGSVRQPAAFCGVVGIKPTYGRVSRYGLVAFASSMDQVGTVGRTVEDATALLEVVAGHDSRDARSAARPVPPLLAALENGARGLVVGVPREYLPDDLHPGLGARLEEAADALAAAGAVVRSVRLPSTGLALPAYYVLAPAEASSNLARFDGVRYGVRGGASDTVDGLMESTRSAGFGTEVQRRIMLGTYALSAGYHDRYYRRAQQARLRIAADFERVFGSGVDVILTPTTPTPAFRLGERLDDPYAMYLADLFTTPANLAGLPAVSVPIGTVDGLPVGGQLMAASWEEPRLLRAARALERAVEDAS